MRCRVKPRYRPTSWRTGAACFSRARRRVSNGAWTLRIGSCWRGPLVLLYKEGIMRMGRLKVALMLTDDERQRLESLAYARTVRWLRVACT